MYLCIVLANPSLARSTEGRSEREIGGGAAGTKEKHIIYKNRNKSRIFKRSPAGLRAHRKNRREGGNKHRESAGGKNMASGRGTTSGDREGVGRGTF